MLLANPASIEDLPAEIIGVIARLLEIARAHPATNKQKQDVLISIARQYMYYIAIHPYVPSLPSYLDLFLCGSRNAKCGSKSNRPLTACSAPSADQLLCFTIYCSTRTTLVNYSCDQLHNISIQVAKTVATTGTQNKIYVLRKSEGRNRTTTSNPAERKIMINPPMLSMMHCYQGYGISLVVCWC